MSDKYTEDFFKQYEQNYMPKNNPDALKKPNKPVRKRKKHKYRFVYYLVLFLLSFAITFSVLNIKPNSGENGVNNAIQNTEIPENVEPIEQTPVSPYIQPDANTVHLSSEIDSLYAILIDAASGRIVAEKNYDQRIYPASMTKVMTLLVAVENVKDFNATFEMTYEIIDPLYVQQASLAGFANGEDVLITDLLYGSILPSGAEATYALALHVAGSEEEFVKLMNQKAQQLGLENTHFSNTSGLHSTENYTTPYDMALILKAASENELAAKVLSTYQYTTNPTPENPEGILLTSTLFSRMTGEEPENGAIIKGGKTGFVSESGNCIASFGNSATGNKYIFVSADANGLWKSIFDHINVYSKYVN